jgi:hypothetical protein
MPWKWYDGHDKTEEGQDWKKREGGIIRGGHYNCELSGVIRGRGDCWYAKEGLKEMDVCSAIASIILCFKS